MIEDRVNSKFNLHQGKISQIGSEKSEQVHRILCLCSGRFMKTLKLLDKELKDKMLVIK